MIHGKSLAIAQLAALIMMGDSPASSSASGPSRDDIERERMYAQERHRRNLAKKGAKEYHIKGHTVTARSFENALKKVNKKLSNLA
jgi:hypothetical protein